MKRVIATIALAAAVSLSLLGLNQPSATAAAPVPLGQAERLCEKSGGLFVATSPLSYSCLGAEAFSHQQPRLAARLCERAGGLFVFIDPHTYTCVLPGGTLPPLP